MFMIKKGQITIFVILGIIIVSIIVFAIFLRSEILINLTTTEVATIEDLSMESRQNAEAIQECVKSFAKIAIINAGETAGFFDIKSTKFEYANTPVYVLFENDQNLMPMKNVLENNLANQLSMQATECANIQSKLKISSGRIENVEVDIQSDKISYSVEWPIRFEGEEFSERLSKFYFEIPIRLGTIYDVIDDFIEEQVNEPSTVCLNCLINIAQANNLLIRATPVLNKYVFLVEDLNDDEPYMFLFGGILS